MTPRSSLLAATVLVVVALTVLTGCGAPAKVAPKVTAPARVLIAGTWRADAICPAVRVEINKYAPWAVQPDNTNRACLIIGQVPPEQNVGVIVALRGGSGECPHRHFTDNTHTTQVSGLGAQACLVTHTLSKGPLAPEAVVEWGIRFDAEHSIYINCSNQTNDNLGQLMPECWIVLQAVLASLYRNSSTQH